MYKKSAVALAVSAVFAAPALAQETVGNIQIYGKLYPAFASFKASGATQPGTPGLATLVAPTVTAASAQDFKQRYSVDTYNSYLGFRGDEKLGGALSAIWQIETQLNFDNPDQFWATRNSFLGLRSNFGTVKLGNMDSAYKEFGDQFSMFGLNSGNFTSASNALSHIGLDTVRQARFHERLPNSVQYLSPEFGDFSLGIQYSPDEQKGNPGESRNRKILSYGVKYDSNRIYLSVHQEKHYDLFGGSINSDASFRNSDAAGLAAGAHSVDTGTRFSAALKVVTDQTVTFDIARLDYKESSQRSAGRFEKYAGTNWAMGWEARWAASPFRTGVQYVKMNEGECSLSGGVACSTSGLDGKVLNLGTAYDLSKRTFLFALYSQLTNGPSARFDNWPNGDAARGADTKQWSLGVQHRF